jgi:GNAT superfamily N-acetyltransferase
MSAIQIPTFLIKPVEDVNLNQLGEFLERQSLGYPEYEAWVRKTCLPELYFRQKRGICAITNGTIVADIIFQNHEQLPGTLEIKNLRVHDGLRRTDIAHFLMKQAEGYAKQAGCQQIIADFRAGKSYSSDLLTFLHFCGYQVLFQTELYPDGIDYVVGKRLSSRSILV